MLVKKKLLLTLHFSGSLGEMKRKQKHTFEKSVKHCIESLDLPGWLMDKLHFYPNTGSSESNIMSVAMFKGTMVNILDYTVAYVTKLPHNDQPHTENAHFVIDNQQKDLDLTYAQCFK